MRGDIGGKQDAKHAKQNYMGKPQVVRRQKTETRENPGLELLLGFLQERQGSLGLTSLNNFSWPQGIGAVPSCLVSGPGTIKAEEYCLLGCTGQVEEI